MAFFPFNEYIKAHKVMDSDLIKKWQTAINDFAKLCNEKKDAYNVSRFLSDFDIPFPKEFRRLLAYFIREGKIEREGSLRQPIYLFPAKIENKHIQEWYADDRLHRLSLIEKKKSEKGVKKGSKASTKVKIVPPQTNSITIQYDPRLNHTDIDNDEWGVIQWLKNRGYKVSKVIEKVL